MTSVPQSYITLAHELADAAGEIIRGYYRTPVAIVDKSDESPVTVADRDSEAAMRKIINAKAPGHGIYGEEWGIENPDAEWVWVLDPVDGTKAFISGVPTFGTLIALLHNGVPVLGVINQCISHERWLGVAGQPTRLNGQEIKVRACPELKQASLFATAPEMFKGSDLTAWETLRAQVKLPRYGADCYAYGLLACGFVDLVVEASLQPYDYCSLVPIVEGAGGIMTDWQGNRLGLKSDGRVVAAGDHTLHAATLKVLAQEIQA
jgi:inositol-phosphate phosphatase/L-galactose 1-phosphate phosphatase/histidinol-phosphatase